MLAPVATYPPIGDRERDDALRRIALALHRHDDPRRSEAGSEPREVLAYLRARHAGLPRALDLGDRPGRADPRRPGCTGTNAAANANC